MKNLRFYFYLIFGILHISCFIKNSFAVVHETKPVKDYNSYSQSVHMYICIEALKLMKDKFPGYNFSEFDIRIGSMDNTGSRPWQMGRVTTGAYREDVEDVVFGIRGPFDFFVSCSHFWNVDNRTAGDHSLTTLNILGLNHDYPNAFTKMKNFASGDWKVWEGNGYGPRKFIEYNTSTGYVFRYSLHHTGLIEFYRTNRIWLESKVNHLGQELIVRNFTTVTNEVKNIICWEILGRMCHLVQDLTVAAHIHNDVHANVPGIGGDCYHDYIDGGGFNNYNWQTAKNNGGFINPYTSDQDPLRYITYTSAQLADHYPSGPDCLEIPQQHLGNNNLPGGTYPIIDNYYQQLGPPPANIANVHETGTYCFNHAIRATASLLYWFGVETGLLTTDPLSLPKVTGFTKNLPDFKLFRGETLITKVNATGPNLNYDWFIKVCDTNNHCTVPIPGIQTTETGNTFNVSNINFRNNWTCMKYDTLCSFGGGTMPIQGPLYFKIGVRVFNQFGSVTKYFQPSEFFSPLQSLRPPPNISGCPFLFTRIADRYQCENNLLYKNSFDINQNKDSDDLYFLKAVPNIDYDFKTIKLALKETINDRDYFDYVSLYSVDHPENSAAGIDINGNVVLYFSEDNVSPDDAFHNEQNVTEELKFDSLYEKTVIGKEKDIIKMKFPSVQYGNKFSDLVEDSIAFIIDPFHYEAIHDPGAYKREAGQITATDILGNYKSGISDFAIRELRTCEIIPLFKSNSISSAEITWKRGFDISYAVMTKVYYGGYEMKKLDMAFAEDFKNGNVKDFLLYDDNVYAVTDSSSFIEMKFKIPDYGPAQGYKRDYLIVLNGKYIRENVLPEKLAGINSTEVRNNKTPSIIKLIGNFPNPFNPATKIKYELISGSNIANNVTLTIYNLLGKEIATLVNEKQMPGIHEVHFDMRNFSLNGSNLTSGVYFYKLTAGESIEIGKMLLIK